VLIAEPYKSELLPLWRFKTPAIARRSAAALWSAFVAYRRADEPVGMDMARKFLQMGFTRARRYANHRSGVKYERDGAPARTDPGERWSRPPRRSDRLVDLLKGFAHSERVRTIDRSRRPLFVRPRAARVTGAVERRISRSCSNVGF
jgi:hypothetical protein